MKYKIAIALTSLCCFLLMVFLLFPYDTNWDSSYIFSTIKGGDIQIDSWMGWCYPLIWKGLYDVSGFSQVMGAFQIFIFWLSISIIAVCLLPHNLKGYLIFLLFSLFPNNILFIAFISNNSFLYCILLLALAMWSVRLHNDRHSRIYLILCYSLLLVSCFVRREALFFIVPLAIVIIRLELGGNLRSIWSWLISICVAIVIFLVPLLFEKAVTSRYDDYNKFSTYQLTALVDFTGMSIKKGELLWPDYIINDEYKGREPEILEELNNCPYIYDDMTIFEYCGLKKFLKSNDIWRDTRMKNNEIIRIYLHNILYYIRYRAGMAFQLAFNSSCMFVNAPMEGYDELSGNRYLYSIRKYYPGFLKCAGVYLMAIIIAIGSLVFKIKKSARIHLSIRRWVVAFSVLLSVLLAVIVVVMGCPSAQVRYLYPYILIGFGAIAVMISKIEFSNEDSIHIRD